MSTFFSRFKKLALGLVVLIYTFVAFALFYAIQIKNVQAYHLNQTFYFLVHTNPNIEVGAYTVPLNGGAGYLLKTSSGEKVAYSVYTQYFDAERAQKNISESTIEQVTLSKLYFKTKQEKRDREKLVGAMQSIYGCIEVLQTEINRLSKGATQESCKRVLENLQGVLLCLEKERVDLPQIAKNSKKLAEELQKSIDGIVYCKDLRYILCQMCFSYAEIASKYSL